MVSRNICRAERVRLARIALSASALAAVLLPVKFVTPAEAKTPGSTYCYYGVCHRVKTIEETKALVGVEQTIVASHYDDCNADRYNPCGLTSSGEKFHPDRPDNAASPIYPDGTTLLVWSPETERALVVRINNAGPYWGDRTLDLSRAAAEKLGFEGKGVATLKARIIKAPDPEEATYVANRNYRPVPGDIGEYPSLKDAQYGMAVALALQASAASPLAPVTTANAFGAGTEHSEPLVAEAPQAPGRSDTRLAEAEPTTHLASVTLGGHALGGTLFKGLFKHLQSTAPQSRPQLASLSLDRGLNQSVWGRDRLETEFTSTPDAAADETVVSPDKIEAAAERAEDAAEKAEAKEQQASEEAKPRKVHNEVAKRSSHRSRARAERRGSRASRTARSERRRVRAQVAFSERSYESRPARPHRSAEQITSLGIRARASAM